MMRSIFHCAVADWFERHFSKPSPVQAQAWPQITAGQNTLITAPTGSGKTLAAFLAAINQLIVEGLQQPLEDKVQVLYVSPLKALSNDIHKNLELPLNGIRDALLENGFADIPIRTHVRTGDTPQSERAMVRRNPPHILVTTPESLFILLTSESGRDMLGSVRTVIVDELHAVAGNKRGAHLMLSLERLEGLCSSSPVRIGISATQKPLSDMAAFLVGKQKTPTPRHCHIVDTGHQRDRDLAIELTGSPLEAIMANEVWDEVYDRLQTMIEAHRTTLIFVNTRRLAERAAAALAERIGEEAVTSHHGSLAKEHRLEAEQRLKQGKLRALVATASLELGIDIGDIDLVCQMGSPRSIAAFLQRAGRAGHQLTGISKARLFPLSRDDLVESCALLQAIDAGELDRIVIPEHPLDVLAQQIVAEVSAGECSEDELFERFTQARPYQTLSREAFEDAIRMLSDGYHTRRGRRGAYLHRDGVNKILRPRRGARLTAITNGGAIPDLFEYDVILQPEGLYIGSLNEDFSFESMPGDIFQLGNLSYKILKIEQGRMHVEDAHGQPPTIPFWIGEAPGRSDELSSAVSQLRAEVDHLLDQGHSQAQAWLEKLPGVSRAAAAQLLEYLANSKAALEHIPTQQRLVFERFFDETGDMHFIIHAPFGSRINKAWGLALRKRFCRQFNFELQAAANEDALILSLGPTHSFPLQEPASYLNPETVEQVLVQALLDAPMFPTRWRWVTNISLAVPRFRGGKRVPAPFQRNDAEDLVALVFPDQLACLENIQGEREVPDHPLVNQVLDDCLHELMDIEGLKKLLRGMRNGDIEVVTRDLSAPSPMAFEIINSRPYAFLDDTEAEERRTLAIRQQPVDDLQQAYQLGRLSTEAIQLVTQQAWPDPVNREELHDALVLSGFIFEHEVDTQQLPTWQAWMDELGAMQRATRIRAADTLTVWCSAERLHELQGLRDDFSLHPSIAACEDVTIERETAIRQLCRSRLEALGPVRAERVAAALIELPEINFALQQLQQQGIAIEGQFTESARHQQSREWCDRRLLARMHQYSLKQKRKQVEPVSPAQFMCFLFAWQGLEEPGRGADRVSLSLQQLEGVSVPAALWEGQVLPARVHPYFSAHLDELCDRGEFVWLRKITNSSAERSENARSASGAVRNTPISLVSRKHLGFWLDSRGSSENKPVLTGAGEKVHQALRDYGPGFFEELLAQTGLLKSQLEQALAELVSAGLLSSDRVQGLRALITKNKPQSAVRQRRNRQESSLVAAGRWFLLRSWPGLEQPDRSEFFVRLLLKRYGVVFRRLLEREQGLPPWRDLLYVLRRLEAREEVRGGRFVQGFSGEQFALPEAVTLLKQQKNRKTIQEVVISSADPLNLTGLITPGARVSAATLQQIYYRDGKPLAYGHHKSVQFDPAIKQDEQWMIRNRLIRQPSAVHEMPPESDSVM